MSRQIYLFVFISLCFKSVLTRGVGESCYQNGASGRCLRLRDCSTALANPYARRNLQNCGFDGREPIICCLDRAVDTPVATPAPIKYTTPEPDYIPPLNDYSDLRSGAEKCANISEELTSSKTGRKAWDKCIEYQEQLVYPCEPGVAFIAKLIRANYCQHNVDELIVGGKDAKRVEFPHMALLDYDTPSSGLLCGGTVISDRFILTAGHCTSKGNTKVAIAKVGILRRNEDVPASRIYRIKRIIKHPDYKPPSKYNDIALLETETPIKLDSTVIPACLDTGARADDSRASVTGWGKTASHEDTSEVLQKVTLTKFTTAECLRRFRPRTKNLVRGFDESSQICYGDHAESKDACQGDSGGPLQIHNSRIHCMYTVVGVTSYGRGCGSVGLPGIYTRVAAFTPWIESIVWP